MTHITLLIVGLLYTAGFYATAVSAIHANHKSVGGLDPSLADQHGIVSQMKTDDPESDNYGTTTPVDEGGATDVYTVKRSHDTDASERGPVESDNDDRSTDATAEQDSHQKDTDPQDKAPADGEPVIDALARQDAIDDMHRIADEMKSAAKGMHTDGKEQAKTAKDSSNTTTTSSTAIPKDSGNIIITNNTHDARRDTKEKEDQIKALRSATESLYQRAHHKNLPVGEPGDLVTPEQIYQALNKLEYIIDGYRRSQLESPNPDLNITEEPDKPDTPPDSPSEDGEIAEAGRFLQTNSSHKHNNADEDDDMDDLADEEENDNDDEPDEDGTKGNTEGKDDGGGANNAESAASNKNEKKMTSEAALSMLESTITELVGILNQVVATNTGVNNVLVNHKREVEQIK
ncbi:hypothetical protein X943_001014 [Babesia divergens]|uniref:Uncharacterized protein n=1 Tax=Babesia divergens TaxID=32595 RepID=A0AAD9LIY2_BABDI|nr:hypothetical protein X943_001014 [Babesia divergens]